MVGSKDLKSVPGSELTPLPNAKEVDTPDPNDLFR